MSAQRCSLVWWLTNKRVGGWGDIDAALRRYQPNIVFVGYPTSWRVRDEVVELFASTLNFTDRYGKALAVFWDRGYPRQKRCPVPLASLLFFHLGFSACSWMDWNPLPLPKH